jgi:hypothetical protein
VLAEALGAIQLVKLQGEGTATSPLFGPSAANLAHYYRFGEILHEKRIALKEGQWGYTGPELKFPSEAELYPMAPIPPGGYPKQSRDFDAAYSDTLHLLQAAWESDDQGALLRAVDLMMDKLHPLAVKLMETPLGGGTHETYRPSFLLV